MSKNKRTKTVITEFDPEGNGRCLGDPELVPIVTSLGTSRRKRVTRVEPVDWLLRVLFYAIRWLAPDTSWLAEFTRRWPCKWQARIFDGPTLGPHVQRQSAIDAEREWIIQNVFHYGGGE